MADESSLNQFLDRMAAQGVELYPAQEEAVLELAEGKNVILNTPTGSGKSLVAAFVHADAMAAGRRSIYTCPIKALVNEKFLSLCREFGAENVGMITGDATVNADAPIICCTAEILSNFALRLGESTPYADVIMDEFHYYSDRERGAAWQIPLLILKKTRFLLMSATLGDTSLFERELTELNGRETVVVRSTDRPVPLDFEYSEKPLQSKILELIASGKTPIYLVNFTQRDAADQAQNLLSVDFCTKEEKQKIAEFIQGENFKSPYGKDLQRFLKHGLGLHHAGLLPRYRVLVEKLSQKGLLKVISGTDTLGVGVNVPIRTVLFTKLCKFDGEKTTILSVRDFQQISGRAGRKGYDDRGSVVVQAPEHVIENLVLEQKAAGDPKKTKKLVKRKPPEKGYVPWTRETMTKLAEGQPEPLTSRFNVNHAMILNVLSRPDTRDCEALRDLIRRSHETPHQKKRQFKLGWQLFRSLVDRWIIELDPLRVNLDLQQDFSLNQSLSLFLLDAIALLDPASENYALDLLTLAESILENPDLILRRQVDRLKTELMDRLKAEGVEYEERLEALEAVEYPKPNQDLIYQAFNAFAAAHPWVGLDNIRPKSIAREMFETYQSFADYIREYGIERGEGILLRYLTEVYKVLLQTVPESARTDDVELMLEYFGTLLRDIDSSLLEEWEKLRDPSAAERIAREHAERDAAEEARRLEKERRAREERTRVSMLRNQLFRGLRQLANRDYESAATTFNVPSAQIETAMSRYFAAHPRLLLDQKARSAHLSRVDRLDDGAYQVSQTLTDPEGNLDWRLEARARVETVDGTNQIRFESVEIQG